MTTKLARILWTTALVAACSPAATPRPTPVPEPTKTAEQRVDRYIELYGGLAGVYRSILAETDCAALQDSFYTATDNGSLGYQAVIMEQGRALSCPDLRFTRP